MKNVLVIGCILVLLLGCESAMINDPVLEEAESAEEEVVEPEPIIEVEPVEEIEEPLELEIEEPTSSLDSEVAAIFAKSEKVRNYKFTYKNPYTNQFFKVWVKGSKIRIDPVSDIITYFLDTKLQTAEKYCTKYSRCGRQTGKMEDIIYDRVYVTTPFDWAAKITDAEIKGESDHKGKESVLLYTNIGEVIVDENFGFIYSVKQEDGIHHSFSDAGFNRVKDEEVVPPEHLIPK